MKKYFILLFLMIILLTGCSEKKGDLVLDKKLTTSLDISKKLYMNTKTTTQKYKKRYCFSI